MRSAFPVSKRESYSLACLEGLRNSIPRYRFAPRKRLHSPPPCALLRHPQEAPPQTRGLDLKPGRGQVLSKCAQVQIHCFWTRRKIRRNFFGESYSSEGVKRSHRTIGSAYTLRKSSSFNKQLSLRSLNFMSSRHFLQTGSAPLYVFSQNSHTLEAGSSSILVLMS